MPESACGACLDGFMMADCNCNVGAVDVTFSHVVEAGQLVQVEPVTLCGRGCNPTCCSCNPMWQRLQPHACPRIPMQIPMQISMHMHACRSRRCRVSSKGPSAWRESSSWPSRLAASATTRHGAACRAARAASPLGTVCGWAGTAALSSERTNRSPEQISRSRSPRRHARIWAPQATASRPHTHCRRPRRAAPRHALHPVARCTPWHAAPRAAPRRAAS